SPKRRRPSSVLRLIVTLRLLRLKRRKYPLCVSPLSFLTFGAPPRAVSPPSGLSTLTTSAPWSASIIVQYGPATWISNASTLTPSRGLGLISPFEMYDFADQRSFASCEHMPAQQAQARIGLDAERSAELDARRTGGEYLVDVAPDLLGRPREREAVEQVVGDALRCAGERRVKPGDDLEVALHPGKRECACLRAIFVENCHSAQHDPRPRAAKPLAHDRNQVRVGASADLELGRDLARERDHARPPGADEHGHIDSRRNVPGGFAHPRDRVPLWHVEPRTPRQADVCAAPRDLVELGDGGRDLVRG